MKKILPFIILNLASCVLNKEKQSCENESNYVAKGNFGAIEISHFKLDSIISSLPFWKVSEYKTIEPSESIAVQILRRELLKNNQEPKKFLILEIIENSDQNITFYLSHIDQYVYLYNLKQDSDAIPLMGNATGFEGWYTIDMEKEEISISYAQ